MITSPMMNAIAAMKQTRCRVLDCPQKSAPKLVAGGEKYSGRVDEDSQPHRAVPANSWLKDYKAL